MVIWIQNPFDNLPCEGFRKQRFWLMAEAFAAAGHRVTFWTSDFSHASKAPRKIIAPLPTAFSVRFVPTPPYARNVGLARVRSHRAYARNWEEAARASLRGCADRPDAIIASLPTISGACAALALGREAGAKVVVDVMDAWPETFERLAPRGLRGLAKAALAPLRRQAQRLYAEADLVTGVCERYRELTGRADYHLAYHGVEIGGDPVGPDRAGRTAIRLVYAGNLGRTYDLATVFKAVAENPDFTLEIAGNWSGDLPARVTAHGYLGQDALHRLLGSCDVGVIPMPADSWVGIPYKLCDYAKAGLRIVSSLGGESAELIAAARCGATYRTGDAASLANAVREVADLPRAASRTLCEKAFDANRIYADYVRRVERLFS